MRKSKLTIDKRREYGSYAVTYGEELAVYMQQAETGTKSCDAVTTTIKR